MAEKARKEKNTLAYYGRKKFLWDCYESGRRVWRESSSEDRVQFLERPIHDSEQKNQKTFT